MFELFSKDNILSFQRERIRKKNSWKIISWRAKMRYKIKYKLNTMCFNKINFYQLHGKLIPTVFNKNPKFTREDVNRNNDESEARDYEIMSD